MNVRAVTNIVEQCDDRDTAPTRKDDLLQRIFKQFIWCPDHLTQQGVNPY
jgi:hypothetical protein